MSLSTAYFDSLPYIDKEPTPDERAAAEALIEAEKATVKPRVHELGYMPTFTPAMSALLDACPTRQGPLITAIDLSRYEDPAATDAEVLAGAKDADPTTSPLHRLCAAHEYLAARRENLSLLEQHGPNAWLLGNYHIEGQLRALEADVEVAKREVDLLADDRRRAQDNVAGEMASLDDGWKKGVERVIGVQIAVEVARAQVRDGMRAAVA